LGAGSALIETMIIIIGLLPNFGWRGIFWKEEERLEGRNGAFGVNDCFLIGKKGGGGTFCKMSDSADGEGA
jgi:hypothetical protein